MSDRGLKALCETQHEKILELQEMNKELRTLLKAEYKEQKELEAENRIFRSTESVDDSVWDALLEQVRNREDKLAAVMACETYLCEFIDIGKIGPAYRVRDVLEAIGTGERR